MRLMRSRACSRRTLGAAASVFVSMLCAASLAQEETSYVVRSLDDDCVNVRVEPNTSGDVQDCLAQGSRVVVSDSIPYWRKITYESDRVGWIAKKFLASLPTSEPSPSGAAIPPDAWLAVHFIDVGQGDAIWIATHDDGIEGNGSFEGRNIVIDGGPNSSDGENEALKYLESRAHHMAIIDALLVTHPHTDHFLGAESLSRHFEIEDYYDPGYPSTRVGYNAFLNAMRGNAGDPARAKHVHIGIDNFGALDWGSEIDAKVLYAWRDGLTGMGSGNTKENNSSIVLKLTYGAHSFLFMGDAEGKDRNDAPAPSKYVEKVLLESFSAGELRSTVLKVGHHGSETSSTTVFIETVDAEIVVAQSGRKSFRGTFLPDESTLCRYCGHNPSTQVFRTDEDDESQGLGEADDADEDHIVIRTNGVDLEIVALSNGAPIDRNYCTLECSE